MNLKEKLIVEFSIRATAEVLAVYQRTLKLLVKIDQEASGTYPGYLASMMASELMGAAVHIYTAADSIPTDNTSEPKAVTELEALAAMKKAHNIVDQDAILAEVTKLLKEQIERHTENTIKGTRVDASHN